MQLKLRLTKPRRSSEKQDGCEPWIESKERLGATGLSEDGNGSQEFLGQRNDDARRHRNGYQRKNTSGYAGTSEIPHHLRSARLNLDQHLSEHRCLNPSPPPARDPYGSVRSKRAIKPRYFSMVLAWIKEVRYEIILLCRLLWITNPPHI